MVKPKPPCKNCESRRQACHSTCAEYKEFRATLDRILKEQAAQRIAIEVTSDSIRRWQKKTRLAPTKAGQKSKRGYRA